MQKFGFGTKWIGWLQACRSSAKFSVLKNGSPEGYFSSSRGLRQGDPLSPLLFTLVAEVLTQCFIRAQEATLINGFQVENGRDKIPVLQYADDTLVFLDAKTDEVGYLKSLLLWFELASGLQINVQKTTVFNVNESPTWEDIREVWNCKAGTFPDIYLGAPLAASFKSKTVWQPLLEALRERLAI
ncbi:hypothetical protein ACHQM5_027786 [Ranunculus cassubicifolius]